MAHSERDALALIDAVRKLNPDGTGSVTGRQAADAAGLRISDEDLFELIQELRNANPMRLDAYREGADPGWRLLRLPA